MVEVNGKSIIERQLDTMRSCGIEEENITIIAGYWITGLSGAGKTTIGKLLYEKMKEKYPNTVFMDGDILRKVFGDDLGYSKEERRKCAMRYSRLCAHLQEQVEKILALY